MIADRVAQAGVFVEPYHHDRPDYNFSKLLLMDKLHDVRGWDHLVKYFLLEEQPKE